LKGSRRVSSPSSSDAGEKISVIKNNKNQKKNIPATRDATRLEPLLLLWLLLLLPLPLLLSLLVVLVLVVLVLVVLMLVVPLLVLLLLPSPF
jgi:uncharacterized membrane protein